MGNIVPLERCVLGVPDEEADIICAIHRCPIQAQGVPHILRTYKYGHGKLEKLEEKVINLEFPYCPVCEDSDFN